jgi:drug/metabolite transporter (DMT)-like permease
MRLFIRANGTASNERGTKRATTAALGAALLFGSGAPAAKAMLGVADPQMLAGLLYLGSGITLGAVRLLRRATEETPTLRDVAWLASAIALGGVAAPLLLVEGLSRTTASSASLVLALEAPFTALCASVFFGEHLGRRTLEALVLITLGAIATTTHEGGAGDPLGLAAVALACMCWALDNNFTREVAHHNAVTIAALKGLVGGTVNVGIALWVATSWPASGAIIAAGIVGALSYGTSLTLYVVSLRGLGASRAGAYFATAPFIGALAAVCVFSEPVSPRLGLSAALMAVGVWRLLGESHRHRHSHLSIEHFHVHVHDEHHCHAHRADEIGGSHAHWHRHETLEHDHPHTPDLHHRHGH